MLAAVILCAGESSRMGFPKALVEFRGKTFLEHLLSVVSQSAAHIRWTRVVVGAHAEEIRGGLALDPQMLVENPDWRAGQLSSIQTAIASLPKESCEGMLLFLVDHPLVSGETVKLLIREFQESGRPIVVPSHHGKRGHPVIFASKLFDELLAAPLDVGARAVVWNHAGEVLEVPTEDRGVVQNLNDPQTLRQALQS